MIFVNPLKILLPNAGDKRNSPLLQRRQAYTTGLNLSYNTGANFRAYGICLLFFKIYNYRKLYTRQTGTQRRVSFSVI